MLTHLSISTWQNGQLLYVYASEIRIMRIYLQFKPFMGVA